MSDLDYEAAKAAYLALGLPWEAKDLERPTEPDQNSALILKSLGYPSSPASSETRAKTLLNKRSRLLDKAGEALKLPGFDWQSDWSRGPYAAGEPMILLRCLAKDFGLRADLRLQEGREGEARDDLRAQVAIALLAEQEPTYIAHLVAAALRAIALRSSMVLADQRLESPAFLRSLSADIAPLELPLCLPHALRGEAYFSVWGMRNSEILGGIKRIIKPRESQLDLIEEPPIGPFRADGDIDGREERRFCTKLLTFWAEAFRLVCDKSKDPLLLDAELKAIIRVSRQDRSPLGRAVTRVLEVFDGADGPTLKHQAMFRATHSCLLLKALELEGWGRLMPNDLGDFSIDPLSGAPLMAKWRKNSLEVWSIGFGKGGRLVRSRGGFGVSLPVQRG